jgi:hypothetical protein
VLLDIGFTTTDPNHGEHCQTACTRLPPPLNCAALAGCLLEVHVCCCVRKIVWYRCGSWPLPPAANQCGTAAAYHLPPARWLVGAAPYPLLCLPPPLQPTKPALLLLTLCPLLVCAVVLCGQVSCLVPVRRCWRRLMAARPGSRGTLRQPRTRGSTTGVLVLLRVLMGCVKRGGGGGVFNRQGCGLWWWQDLAAEGHCRQLRMSASTTGVLVLVCLGGWRCLSLHAAGVRWGEGW